MEKEFLISKNLLIINNKNYNYIIKLFDKKEYADQFANGILRFNRPKLYNDLENFKENTFRGDKFDSRIAIKPDNIILKVIKPDGEIFWTKQKQIKDFSVSNEYNENLPIFCCSALDSNAVEVCDNKIMLKKEFYEEMKQFGKYFVIMDLGKLQNNLFKVSIKKNIFVYVRKVIYKKIRDGVESYEENEIFESIYKKDVQYKNQNELRIFLIEKNMKNLLENKDVYIEKVSNIPFIQGDFDELYKFGLECNY